MKLEINTAKKSNEIIKGCEYRYSRTNDQPTAVRSKLYLHIYPKKDTLQDDGERLGIFDSYLSEIHIFNTDNNTVYVVPKLYDNIDIQVSKHISVRYFKDLSIFIEVPGPVRIKADSTFQIQEITAGKSQ